MKGSISSGGSRRSMSMGTTDIAARMVDAGGERRFLAEVARQVDDAGAAGRARLRSSRRAQRVVARAVIDEHDLEAKPVALHQWPHRVEEEVDRSSSLNTGTTNDSSGSAGRRARWFAGKLALQRARAGKPSSARGKGSPQGTKGVTIDPYMATEVTRSTAPASRSMMPSSRRDLRRVFRPRSGSARSASLSLAVS